MNEAFLDCYIWVVSAFTEIKKEKNCLQFSVKKVFKYNSLLDVEFKNANDNLTPFFEVQLPDFIIQGVSEKISEEVKNGKEQFVWYNSLKKIWYIK